MAEQKGYKGAGMNGWVARWYAKNTAKDMGAFRELAERLAKMTPAGSRILEVAPGPGYLSIELAKRGEYAITGLDISESFVEIAGKNAASAGVSVDFWLGNACAMPFADGSFDLIVCRAAFKNFSQPEEAINEMYRVLRPGGRALIYDLRRDVPLEEIDSYIRQHDFGWLDSWFMKMTFRYMLIPRAYRREDFAEMAAKSRFGTAEISNMEMGFQVAFSR